MKWIVQTRRISDGVSEILENALYEANSSNTIENGYVVVSVEDVKEIIEVLESIDEIHLLFKELNQLEKHGLLVENQFGKEKEVRVILK